MNYSRSLSTIVLLTFTSSTFAQTPEITIQTPPAAPVVGHLLRPFHFERRVVSPARFSNTARLESLVRGGNLYLSVQDVIALVLENNIDIAIQRYGPVLASEVLRRAQGGGLLRSVGTPIYPGPASVSSLGVNVSAVGLAETGSGVSSGGGIVVGLGPTPPSLDPFLFASANFQHVTSPQSNTVLNPVPALLNDSKSYQIAYGQQFVTGTTVQFAYGSYRSTVNSPSPILNPYTQGFLDFFVSQNLLQGFGLAVNNRYIRVARNNMKVTDLQVKRQVITTISAALNLYWDLVSFNEDVRIKEQALATAQKLYEDNKKQVAIGTLSAIEITRAAAEVSSVKENLLIAQTNVAQQETVLKNALSRNGVASPWMDDVHIVTLDRIQVPEKEELKPMPELVQQALAGRPELQQTRINLESTLINLKGSRNALLPTLQAFADFSNNALTGDPNALSNGANGTPDPYFVGGYGNLLGQIFRRNYPNYTLGFSLNIAFRNRAAQADYVADQLNLRQAELQLQRFVNQVRVDVKNAVISLQQARARYETAVATRVLAQQTLEAEQKKFQFGTSSIPLVVQAQRDLNNDQSAEIQSMANYTHAKVAFDDAMGRTLEENGISMEEAKSGQVARQSSIPDLAPNPKK
jgi:outer membrane protein TolC